MTSNSKNIVLLIDTSGSMEGNRMVQAKKYAQTQIARSTSHTIYGFNDDVTHYSSISSLKADGGTRIQSSLLDVFGRMSHNQYLVLITDGDDSVNEAAVKPIWLKLQKSKNVAGEALLISGGGTAKIALQNIFKAKVVSDADLEAYVIQATQMHAKADAVNAEMASIQQALNTASQQQQVDEADVTQLLNNLINANNKAKRIAKANKQLKEDFSAKKSKFDAKKLLKTAEFVKTEADMLAVHNTKIDGLGGEKEQLIAQLRGARKNIDLMKQALEQASAENKQTQSDCVEQSGKFADIAQTATNGYVSSMLNKQKNNNNNNNTKDETKVSITDCAQKMGFSQENIAKFESQGIMNMADLRDLSNEDLKNEVGVSKLGDRKKILKYFAQNN